MINKITPKLDQWIFEAYAFPPTSLSIFRIFFSAYVLFFIGVPQFRWIAGKPDYFFNPPEYSLFNLFSGFPDLVFLFGLDVLLCVLFVFLLFGFQTRWSSILITVGLLTGFGFSYSFGKINHDSLLLLITPVIMSFSNWQAHYSLDSLGKQPMEYDKDEKWWPVALLALLLGVAMFFAGVPKLLRDWLDLSTHAVQGYVFRQHYAYEANQFLAPYLVDFHNDFFWELLDYSAVIFEISFLFAFLNKKIFRFFIVLAVIFHFANTLILNIDFSKNIALYMLFIDWRAPVAYFKKLERRNKIRYFINMKMLILFLGGLLLLYILGAPPPLYFVINVFTNDPLTTFLVITALACIGFVFNYLQGILELKRAKWRHTTNS